MEQNNSEKKKSILLLHGYTQNSDVFEKRMKIFIKSLSKDLSEYQVLIPNAPHLIDPLDNEKEEAEKKRAWLYLNLNEFEEKSEVEFKGFKESLNMITEIVEKNKVEVIFGFSQGSLLATFLSIMISSNIEYKKKFNDLKCVILCAGFIEPFPLNEEFKERYELIKDLVMNKKENKDAFIDIPTLHIYGETDPYIKKEKSQNLEKLFKNIESYPHPGKHFVPLSKEEVIKYKDFIKKNVYDNVKF